MRFCPYCRKNIESLEEINHFQNCVFFDHEEIDWSKFAGRGEK